MQAATPRVLSEPDGVIEITATEKNKNREIVVGV
jgi:hypothetical protein